jgi:anti-anti-sigma factor
VDAQHGLGGRLRILVEGELEPAVLDRLRALLRGAVGSKALLVEVDLENCDFLDLAALATLLGTKEELEEGGQRMRVVASSGQPRRLLSVTGCRSRLGVDGMPREGHGQEEVPVRNAARTRGVEMLEGCDHCGTIVRRGGHDAVTCPECGRPLRAVDAFEARVLMRERRVAEQFRRANRLRRTADARRGLGSP